jgi:hypothetical protein
MAVYSDFFVASGPMLCKVFSERLLSSTGTSASSPSPPLEHATVVPSRQEEQAFRRLPRLYSKGITELKLKTIRTNDGRISSSTKSR